MLSKEDVLYIVGKEMNRLVKINEVLFLSDIGMVISNPKPLFHYKMELSSYITSKGDDFALG